MNLDFLIVRLLYDGLSIQMRDQSGLTSTTISIDGFKRFKEKQKLSVSGRLTCIMGPNEAGKTSLLKALLRLNDRDAFVNSGPDRETFRGQTYANKHIIMNALYQIEETDRKGLEFIEGIDSLRWLDVYRRVDGTEDVKLIPPIEKTHLRLTTITETLKRSNWPQWMADALLACPHLEGPLIELNRLVSEEGHHAPEVMVEAVEAISREIDIALVPEAKGLLDEIALMVRYEKLASPSAEILRLMGRPKFVQFTSNDLGLLSDYQLNTYFRSNNPEQIPKPLLNFAVLADLDLRKAFEFGGANDTGELESLQDAIDAKLRETLSSHWHQSNLEVRVRFDHTLMSINVRSDKNKFEKIASRSEGLRQFVALVAFLQSHKAHGRAPILLMDELEQHLHYDAQADLVQMLSSQKFVRQIIYTSHSIGCLPEDLGCGVRVLKMDDNGGGSKIVNNFWDDKGPGLSPLLVGMGASTMAFLPTRDCVLTEGPADFLLLPSLIREATRKESLKLQFSPGLAIADRKQLKAMQTQGKRVLHIVDGDEGGVKIRSELRAIGIADEDIFDLSEIGGDNFVLEDLISPSVYCSAVNAELQKSGYTFTIVADNLPDRSRPGYVKAICANNNATPPGKVAIAYQLLESKTTAPILNEKYALKLADFYSRLIARQICE